MITVEPRVARILDTLDPHDLGYQKFLADVPGLWWYHTLRMGRRYTELVYRSYQFHLSHAEICATQKTFSPGWDMFSDNIWSWYEHLAPYQTAPVDILELGVFEGRSLVFMAEYLPQSSLVAVDTFAYRKDFVTPWMPKRPPLTQDSEITFDRNVAVYGDRVRKLVGSTVNWLEWLAREGKRFQIIYLDASHNATDVLVDATLAWRLLVVGGLMILDDFLLEIRDWDKGPSGVGILQFLRAIDGDYEWVHAGWQVMVRKTAEQSLEFG